MMRNEFYLLTTPNYRLYVFVQNGRVARIGNPLRYWRGKEVTLLKSRAAAQNWSLVRLTLSHRAGHPKTVFAHLRQRLGTE